MKYALPIMKLYWSEFSDRSRHKDSNTLLSKAQVFPMNSQEFSKKAAQEGVPWATWLGLELLNGFAEEGERRCVFVCYRLEQGIIKVYVIVRPNEISGPCYKLVRNLAPMPTGMDAAFLDIRPLALWDGLSRTAYRLFPLPAETKKRRGTVLHVDHGNQMAFFSSYVEPIWPRIWKNNLLEYTDYELVPQEKEMPAALRDKKIIYRSAFVVLEPSL